MDRFAELSRGRFMLVLQYYRSTLPLNVALSVLIGVTTLGFGLFGFPVCFMTGGFLAGALWFGLTKKHEYYFYHNRGLSRSRLLLFGFLVNTLTGVFLIFLIVLCRICWKLTV